ncbi:SMC-Scp complex subunit ScpB [Candidatus Kaiserbacteria bacterium]|nr:SMC-Scp complex subunit ScpB [Candidatus Kaiserbacteria bacterium]
METKLEALLFALGRPVSRKELAGMLGAPAEEVETAIHNLSRVAGRGVVLVDDGKEVELRASGEASALIEKIRKEEYGRDIGKAGLEALSAVLYRGPLTRAEIDFIRGVNSSQTLRTLTLRGLVRRVQNPKDERSFLYEPTTELLAELGVERPGDLPDYAQVRDKLQQLEEAYRQKQSDL